MKGLFKRFLISSLIVFALSIAKPKVLAEGISIISDVFSIADSIDDNNDDDDKSSKTIDHDDITVSLFSGNSSDIDIENNKITINIFCLY